MAARNDPRTLLVPDDRQKPYLLDKWISGVLGITSFLCVGGHKMSKGKPFFSGIQTHIVVSLAFIVAGKFIHERRQAYLADRDAVYRHYIDLHPDDFPVPERKLLRDVFKSWNPVR